MVTAYNFNACGQRLLTQDILVGSDRLDGLLGMHGGGRSNDNGFQAFVFKHVIVVLVKLHAVRSEVNLSPFQFRIVRRASCHQVCTRGSFKEVQGMALAHAAETSTADFQLGSRHDEVDREERKRIKRGDWAEKDREREERRERVETETQRWIKLKYSSEEEFN